MATATSHNPVFPLVLLVLFFSQSCYAASTKPIRQNANALSGQVQEIVEESSTWEEGASIFRQRMLFDNRGQVTETETAFLTVGQPQPHSSSKSVNSYDQSGRLIKSILYEENGSVSLIQTFSYDNSGNRTEHISTNREGAVRLRFVFSYDSRGNQIESRSYKRDGALVKRIVQEYDDQNNLIKVTGYEGNGTLEYTVTNRYDNDASLVESFIYKPDGPLDERVAKAHNSNGKLVEENRYRSDGSLRSQTTYTYDARGNWVKSNSIEWKSKPGEPPAKEVSITYRNIKYY